MMHLTVSTLSHVASVGVKKGLSHSAVSLCEDGTIQNVDHIQAQ